MKRTITQQELNQTSDADRRWKYPGVTGPGAYTWNEAQNRYEPASQHTAISAVVDSADEHQDFDGGFGIGGLGRYVEEPIIPTVEQMNRQEALERRARRCRKCGQTDVFDGAMFTVDPESGLCDDCYG